METTYLLVGGLLESISHVGQPYTNKNIPLKSFLEQVRENGSKESYIKPLLSPKLCISPIPNSKGNSNKEKTPSFQV